MTQAAEQFCRIFTWHRNKKIILYGLGRDTEAIIKECSDFHFAGLLDGYRKEGQLWGLSILDIAQLAKGQADEIIIVARRASTKVIWNQIQGICREKELEVFDLQGRSMWEARDRGPVCTHYLSRQYVRRQIDEHEVVSFDIFDTLIRRTAESREKLLEIAAQKCGVDAAAFLSARMGAEFQLGDPATLEEIYRKMEEAGSFDHKKITALKRAEEEEEYQGSYPCPAGVQLLEYAIQRGKEIYLVSDMYLNQKVIEAILAKNQIFGYRKRLVSCEYGMGKRQGLFERMMEQAEGSTFLHIGDDEEADGVSANAKGIDAIIMETSPAQMLYRYPVECRYRVSSSYQLGYTILAPIIAGFMDWLISLIKAAKPDHVLFLARDGFLLDKMYRLAKQRDDRLPPGNYFYFSRSVGAFAYVENEERLRYVAKQPFSGDRDTLLKRRFGLETRELEGLDRTASTTEAAVRNAEKIFHNAKCLRKNFMKYFETVLQEGEKSLLLVDFVSTGSCQLYLEGILKKRLTGAYFTHLEDPSEAKRKLEVYSFFDSSEKTRESNAVSTYLLLEYVLKAPTGTVTGFGDDGVPVLAEDRRSKIQHQRISEMQQGVLDYYEEYRAAVSAGMNGDRIFETDPYRQDAILGYLSESMSDIVIEGFLEDMIYDAYTDRELCVKSLL